jgi:hypothetical protein
MKAGKPKYALLGYSIVCEYLLVNSAISRRGMSKQIPVLNGKMSEMKRRADPLGLVFFIKFHSIRKENKMSNMLRKCLESKLITKSVNKTRIQLRITQGI